MNNQPFYLKRRYKEVRDELFDNEELSHGTGGDAQIRRFFLDMIDHMSKQHPAGEDAAQRYVMRNLAMLFAKDGYKKPFANDSETASKHKPTTPTLPQWRWPVVDPGCSDGAGFDGTFRPQSALKMFGYTVGVTDGWRQSDREAFLSDFMEMNLPAVVEATFDDEYGTPMSAKRLRKIANVIASNASLRARNDPNRYRVAIEQWESDLEFLRRKYYDGLGLKFIPWPSTH